MKKKNTRTVEGVIDFIRSGAAFVVSDETSEDTYISINNINQALNGDKVRVELIEKRGNRPEGKVVKVIGQLSRLFVGVIDIPEQSRFAFFIPDDSKIKDMFIPRSKFVKQSGHKAVARVVKWSDAARAPIGEIVEVLGKAGSNDAEVKGILTSCGINYTFSEEVLQEANQVSTRLPQEEIDRRRDYRHIPTITIDPVDAKDFDDALSVETLSNGNLSVGIHIADVGHYVEHGSVLDKEASERGNSVYLVDRVIPMLPEHLSNGVCSLRPHEEKFTFGAVFELTKTGELVNEWFGKTIIKSDRRFTYQEAQEIIDGKDGDFQEQVLQLNHLAEKLRKERIAEGALEIQGSEVRFKLDQDGKPIDVIKKTQIAANKLVEEFMLLANKRVGRFIGKRKKPLPSIYRIHDTPDKEKLKQFAEFLTKLGRYFDYKDEDEVSNNMNKLFQETIGEKGFPLIQQMAIRTLAKAVYAVENIGHYGLGFEYYAHFTSPIRRYADLMVHRVLFDQLSKSRKGYPDLEHTASHISKTERKAMDAERASHKFFQAVFLKDKIGEEFSGTIAGLANWGMYVEMENHCEGAIPFRTMSDYYQFDKDNYVVRGEDSGKEFNLGDQVQVRIAQVSVPKRQIDLELID